MMQRTRWRSFEAWSRVTLLLFFLFLYSFSLTDAYLYSSSSSETTSQSVADTSIKSLRPQDKQHVLDNIHRPSISNKEVKGLEGESSSLVDFVDALEVMQGHFFEIWLGIWPEAIDWTAAVMGTHVSASLAALTQSMSFDRCANRFNGVDENLINGYFSHLTSFYFGENTFSLRTQAYDDMLWVVLGWLESLKFIDLHSQLHFPTTGESKNSTWYARQFVPAYAHRARIFWDLASNGWDTTLCGGGMVWNPRLIPYKNAITNQLYIAASVSMYLYFPGDNNSFPYVADQSHSRPTERPAVKHDRKYLQAALDAYTWIVNSNMTNSNGLFIDGFHISHRHGGTNRSEGHSKCDIPNRMVYTYNQGVILTGQRGLWEATGVEKYLEDGYQLIYNVMNATGWPIPNGTDRFKWAGLGRYGVLEDACDSAGSCSQNGQTFKGIFFHHLTTFCAALPVGTKDGILYKADPATAARHRESCLSFVPWIAHNAKAALGTKDEHGKFGMWWTYGLRSTNGSHGNDEYISPSEGIDYRNKGVPNDRIWLLEEEESSRSAIDQWRNRRKSGSMGPEALRDPNNRGRGRTVETQSGGLAVLRALYKMMELDHN